MKQKKIYMGIEDDGYIKGLEQNTFVLNKDIEKIRDDYSCDISSYLQ